MATRVEAFCNITTDLMGVEPNIDNYDRKRLIQNFQSHATNVYVAFNSGYVSQSYIDGKEMNMQTSLGAVDSSDDAYFDSAADALYVSDGPVSWLEGDHALFINITSLMD